MVAVKEEYCLTCVKFVAIFSPGNITKGYEVNMDQYNIE
jgi:hypothetical protein